MSGAPINIAISAQDETGPAFASASAKAEAFKSSISTSTESMHEARGAAMLLGEEVGIHMNRHLVNVMASSQLLQGVLTAAFPVVAAIGFIEVIARIPAAIEKMTDFIGGFTEASKHAMDDAVKANEKLLTQFKTIGEGYKALETLRGMATPQEEPKSQWQDALDVVRNMGASSGPLGAWASKLLGIFDSHHKIAREQEAGVHSTDLQLKAMEQLTHLNEERNKEDEKLSEDALRAAIEARNAWIQSIDAASKASGALLSKGDSPADKELTALREQITVWENIRKAHAGVNVIANQYIERLEKQLELTKAQEEASIQISLMGSKNKSVNDLVTGGAPTPGYSGTSQAMELYKITHDQNLALKEASTMYDDARTKLEKYSDAMDKLIAVANATNMSQAQFRKDANQIGKMLDDTSKAYLRLGNEIGRTITQAMFFGESWSKALRNVLADILKLIVQMYVFKALSDAMGGKGGGFFGQLFAGMAGISGKAGGGPVSGGMSYLVGEQGPELFTPGSSGGITPNGGLGGVTQHFDMRGSIVTDDVVRKAELAGAMRYTENRSVARSVAATAQLSARR